MNHSKTVLLSSVLTIHCQLWHNLPPEKRARVNFHATHTFTNMWRGIKGGHSLFV